MGKHEPMSAKAIGKKIKSKGLQKLKFYCQMCQKQCRDANGFKCHLTSEAHSRQLLLFAENPNRYMDDFSSEFMKDFLHLLKRRYSTKRVLANQVYQEYIKDRNHLHMNSTRWCTLTGFVKWMGRKGICHVEQSEKGFYLTYIDRDPDTLLLNEKKAKKEKYLKDDEDRKAKMIADQIERGKQWEEDKKSKHQENDQEKSSQSIVTERQETENQDLDSKRIVFTVVAKKPTILISGLDALKKNLIETKKKKDKEREPKKKSALEEIMEEQEKWKARKRVFHSK